MQSQGRQFITSKRVFIGLFIILFGLLVVWIKDHAILTIDTGNASGSTTIKLTNRTGQTKSYKTASGKKTLLVNSGLYAVSAFADGKSSLLSHSTKNFLRHSTAQLTFKAESARRYVAYNPSPCMFEIGHIFYSVSCGDYATNIERQYPAQGDIPPVTRPITDSGVHDSILAVAPLNDNQVAMIVQGMTDEGSSTSVQVVDQNLQVKNIVNLAVDAAATGLQITPISTSEVLVYGIASQSAWRIDPVSGKVTPLDLASPNTKGMTLADIRTNQGTIVATYTDSPQTDAIETSSLRDAETAFVVLEGSEKTSFTTEGSFRQASACGTGYICAVDFSGLRIFATNKTIHESGFVPGVKEMVASPAGPRFLDEIGVFTYDPSSETGHYEYSYGAYKSCGPQPAELGYLLCLTTPKQEKIALAINQDEVVTTPIDKQILGLLGHREVSGVNAIGNDIFVIPNYGEADLFVRSSARLKEVNSKITTIIKDSGIDPAIYRIRNAAE